MHNVLLCISILIVYLTWDLVSFQEGFRYHWGQGLGGGVIICFSLMIMTPCGTGTGGSLSFSSFRLEHGCVFIHIK
jgi:hypothetical protein